MAALVSILVFTLLFFNRYRLFFMFNKEDSIHEKTKADIQKLQKTITEKKISKNEGKKIRKEMHQFRGYTMYLYDDIDEMDKGYFVSSLENKSYLATSSFLLRLYDPTEDEFDLEFYDGTYSLYVYSYQGVIFMQRYLLVICAFSVLIFISIIMIFVHRKMRYVLQIGDEMKRIEEGDLHHTIVYKGNDEITTLAKQLNHLRNALYDNMVKEEEARKANEELVTAMSHDLRTPLTSLMGYLDIVNMKIYKSEEEHDSYLRKSRKKAEQIKTMSDKLFNHFLVYAQQDEVVCEAIGDEDIRALLNLFCDELKERHFKIYDALDRQSFQIRADCKLLERIFDNLFSNICKYAGRDMVVVSLNIHQGQMSIKVKNKKKSDASKEESTHIGLKSIHKMMKDMGANVVIDEDAECFCVELIFACREIISETKEETKK